MIDNYKEILKVGMVIKNYKVLCSLLHEDQKLKGGCSKKAQYKEWKRYFNYTRQGQKIIITEIYDAPKKKDDKRHGGNRTTHGLSDVLMEYILHI